MKNQSIISKIFASITLASGSVWIGAYLLKLFLLYQLFEPKDLALKQIYTTENLTIVLFSFLPAFLTTIIAYSVMILSLLIYLFSSKVSLRENGWLFISLMIVLITLPFEFYSMFIDYKIISLLLKFPFSEDVVLNLIRARITSLSSFPIIEILSYLSIIFLIIFKPLTLKK